MHLAMVAKETLDLEMLFGILRQFKSRIQISFLMSTWEFKLIVMYEWWVIWESEWEGNRRDRFLPWEEVQTDLLFPLKSQLHGRLSTIQTLIGGSGDWQWDANVMIICQPLKDDFPSPSIKVDLDYSVKVVLDYFYQCLFGLFFLIFKKESILWLKNIIPLQRELPVTLVFLCAHVFYGSEVF